MLAVGSGAVSSPSSEECVEGKKELDQKAVKTSPVLMCNMIGKHYHKVAPPVGKTTCRVKTFNNLTLGLLTSIPKLLGALPFII